jgi:hypothetical protein
MKSPKCTRSENTRKRIDAIITTAGPGATIHTSVVAQTLSKLYSGVSNQTVGNCIRERDDMEWVSCGVWRVRA